MNYAEYLPLALRTEAPFPTREDRFDHAVLGLVTETGELATDVKRLHCYAADIGKVNAKTGKSIFDSSREEIGDKLWYLALLFDVLGVPMKSAGPFRKSDTRMNHPASAWPETPALPMPMLAMIDSEATKEERDEYNAKLEVAEAESKRYDAAKAARDIAVRNRTLVALVFHSEIYKAQLIQNSWTLSGSPGQTSSPLALAAGELLAVVEAECTVLGFDVEEIMQENIDKLRARFPDKFSNEAAEARADKAGVDAHNS